LFEFGKFSKEEKKALDIIGQSIHFQTSSAIKESSSGTILNNQNESLFLSGYLNGIFMTVFSNFQLEDVYLLEPDRMQEMGECVLRDSLPKYVNNYKDITAVLEKFDNFPYYKLGYDSGIMDGVNLSYGKTAVELLKLLTGKESELIVNEEN